MATTGMPKGGAGQKGKKSTSKAHDPLGKWSNEFLSTADTAAHEEADTVGAFRRQIAEITASMSAPGVSVKMRQSLYKALAESKKGLAESQANVNKIVAALKGRGVGAEAALKLADIQKLLWANKDPSIARSAKITEELLKTLIKESEALGASEASNDKVLGILKELQTASEDLPDTIQKKLDKTTALFDKLEEKREREQDKWTSDYQKAKALLDARSKEVNAKWAKLGMGIANRMGVGAFSVGGAIRGYQNVKGAYQGAKSWVKGRQELGAAKKIVKNYGSKIGEGTKEDESNEREDSLVNSFKDYVNDNRQFNRKLLDKMGKTKASGASASEGIASSITEGLAKFFTGEALARLIANIASKVPVGSLATTLMNALSGSGALATALRFALKGGAGLGLLTYSKDVGESPEDLKRLQEALQKPWVGAPPGQAGLPPLDLKYPIPGQSGQAMPGGDPVNGAVVGGGRGFTNPAFVTPEDDASVTPASTPSSSDSSPVSTGSQVQGATGSSIQQGSGVDLSDLDPKVKHNMEAMADEYFQLTGKKLPVNSAFRSMEQQANLYNTMPAGRAAAPGQSLHNYGFAFDTNSADGKALADAGLLSKYGFANPIKSEPWHIQPSGITLAAAKAGLYSADAPANQGATTTASSRPANQAVTPAVSPLDSGTAGAPTMLQSASNGKGTMGAPSQNSVKTIPTFDQSDGLFLAMNMGIA